MASRKQGAKRPWSRERWFFMLLVPVYGALVVSAAATGAFAPPEAQAVQVVLESRAANGMDQLLPTSDPALSTPMPTRAPESGLRKLDINEADTWMLTAIPGIGQTMAERIIAYRDGQGGLQFIDELARIEGVGEKLYATLIVYLEVR